MGADHTGETSADADTPERLPQLSPRVKSALLWGAVGALTFLVLVQGYALLVGPLVSIAQGGAIAFVVGTGAAVAAYLFEYRIARWAARREMNGSDSTTSTDQK